MKENFYMNTGELAKIFDLSKQTLFYYDSIGLFSPALKEENGYRKYSLHQVDELDVILSLRNIGLSIDDIKEYISNKNTPSLIELLTQQENNIKKEIKKLKKIEKKISSKVKYLQGSLNIDKNKILIEECEEEYYLVTKCNSSDSVTIMNCYNELARILNEKAIYLLSPLCAIISKENLLNYTFYEYSYLGSKITSTKNIKDFIIKPKGTYGVIYHEGYYDTTESSYKKLMEYINSNGFKIVGNSYEEDILNSLAVKSPNEYLTKLSVQIEKIK